MKALLSKEVGGPETLVLEDMPTPEVTKNHVLIRVHAAGVNFPDTLIIRDLYQLRPPRPFAPGGEFSGVIERVGDGVEGFSAGDRVIAMTGFGAFATHVLAEASRCIRIPDAMPFDEAACLMLTYGTSHHALKDRAELTVRRHAADPRGGGRCRRRRDRTRQGGRGAGHRRRLLRGEGAVLSRHRCR